MTPRTGRPRKHPLPHAMDGALAEGGTVLWKHPKRASECSGTIVEVREGVYIVIAWQTVKGEQVIAHPWTLVTSGRLLFANQMRLF